MPHTTINQDGSIHYRTKLLPLTRAAAFARMLDANSTRFQNVEIVRSERSKQEAFFVQFSPVSRDRQTWMYQAEWDKRTVRASEQEFIFFHDDRGPFWWCLSGTTGNTYEVTPFGCTCEDYVYRCEKAGLHCKHIQALDLQSKAGTLGKTDKTTPTTAPVESREAFRSRMLASIAQDF